MNYLLWIPLVGFAVWFVIWRLRFSTLENVFGLMGLALSCSSSRSSSWTRLVASLA